MKNLKKNYKNNNYKNNNKSRCMHMSPLNLNCFGVKNVTSIESTRNKPKYAC